MLAVETAEMKKFERLFITRPSLRAGLAELSLAQVPVGDVQARIAQDFDHRRRGGQIEPALIDVDIVHCINGAEPLDRACPPIEKRARVRPVAERDEAAVVTPVLHDGALRLRGEMDWQAD